jgi:hypothetical protein
VMAETATSQRTAAVSAMVPGAAKVFIPERSRHISVPRVQCVFAMHARNYMRVPYRGTSLI